METGQLYDFGPFRLDAQKHLLLRGSQPVVLTPKALETLIVLVENSGRVMEKDELMSKLWPDTIVEEANLAQHISTLRKILGESPGDHTYIITLPGRGYRFVAEVRRASDDTDELIVEKRTVSRVILEETEGGQEAAVRDPGSDLPQYALSAYPPRSKYYRLKFLALALLGVATAIVLGGLAVKNFQTSPPRPEIKHQQLTSNPVEVPVLGAAISSDGKYLATIDQTGIYLRIMKTGETHSVPFLKGFTPSLFPLKWFPDGTQLLVSGVANPDNSFSLWAVSIFGGAPRKLGEGSRGAVSPDGSLIAYVAGPNALEIRIMGANGEAPRKIVTVGEDESIETVAWAPNGNRIAYVKNRIGDPLGRIESCDLNGGHQTEILPGAKFGDRFDFAWSPDGRIIFPLPESQSRDRDTDLWEVQVSPETGVTTGGVRQLTNWPRSLLSNLTLTADGRSLVVLRAQTQPDVYVGALKQNGTPMVAPRRLTMDDRDDWPQSWTPDSRTVLFHSNRQGNAQIFGQDLAGGEARVVVTSSDEEVYPRTSPDGRWVLYWAYSEREPNSWRLMRAPISGGPGEFVLKASRTTWFRCPSRHDATCVLDERSEGQIVFYALDPILGKGVELKKVAITPNMYYFWDLSPDGSQIAIVANEPNGGRFQIVSLSQSSPRNIKVRNWSDILNVVWSADGTSFLAFTRPRPIASLLSIDFQGNARVLWKSVGPVTRPQEPVPSPDGKSLAFAGWTSSTNAWVIENF
ncbi:MAG TPA: winged helix-turn-helix domain-containing protein [Terriglobia bacterium]|nr:winged helix-turn-helix domain-containing protein [Terriglobia bacterium]